MSDTVLVAKRGYVSMMRAVRSVVEPLGMGRVAVNAREHRYRHWLQSLLAIHDIDALIRLDVPWWTYDAIERVDAFLASRPGARVFEWGSGASTVWLAKRAESVISIDHDAPWVEFSAPRLAEQGNARVELVPVDARADRDPQFLSGKPGYAGQTFRSYVEAIDRHEGRFDLIVIDGRARAACLNRAIDRLARGGLIVFDNSHRARYRKAIAASGLRARVTRGLVPSLPLPDQTTLLRR
jgi:hypothetical protein